MDNKPIIQTVTGEHYPGQSGKTKAFKCHRTFNLRVAMGPAREAMGEIAAGERFESIAYPSLGAVLVRRVQP